MKKAKKIFLTLLSYGLVVALAITGTVAYLTSTDSDVNVMTLGNVQIEQLEYERVVENDAWVSTGETDEFGYTPDKVQEYNQNKPLYPAVFADGNVKWDDRNGNDHQQSWGQVGANGSNQLFDDSVRNAQDKFVFVKNTGNTPCYFRTVYAFEVPEELTFGDAAYDHIGANVNSGYTWSDIGYTTIDGVRYYIMFATYGNWNDGVLSANEIARPSLLQVALNHNVTNEQVALFGETYDVKVLTQAVQVEGFADAETALDAAFDEISIENHPFK